MGAFFQGAKDHLERLTDEELHDTEFVLFAEPAGKGADLGGATAETAALLNDEEARERFTEHALRIQIIPDPGAPNGVRNRFLQLFLDESTPTDLHTGSYVGIVAERSTDVTEDALQPLAVLDTRDMQALVSGEGFAVPLPAPEME